MNLLKTSRNTATSRYLKRRFYYRSAFFDIAHLRDGEGECRERSVDTKRRRSQYERNEFSDWRRGGATRNVAPSSHPARPQSLNSRLSVAWTWQAGRDTAWQLRGSLLLTCHHPRVSRADECIINSPWILAFPLDVSHQTFSSPATTTI